MTASSVPVRPSRAESDLEALLARMRRRLYPETIPVLVSYWLKTVYAAGHKRDWWKDLNKLLKQVLREQFLDAPSRQALMEVRAWIQQDGLLTAKTPPAAPPGAEPFRANLRTERLAPYIGQLLNHWLSAEVARLLVNESEPAFQQDGGIPALATGRALERLLVRERLSPGTLEMLLQPELLSPREVYPADAEMLRDVVLALLGRTAAPATPVMPATLLGVAPGSPLPPDYREAVLHASYVECQGSEEVHVPIRTTDALEILKGGAVRIASIIVTTDGRWWESENLQSGEQYTVVYRPVGRLRIDYSADHARLDVPWPDTQLGWSGVVHFQDPFELFGREWRASSWETDGQRTWLHLVFSRALPVVEVQPDAEPRYRQAGSAAADIAWAALENALAAAMLQHNREPIEQLRRPDFIPLGRAIFELAQSMKHRRLVRRETIEIHLRAIRYLQAVVSLEYGRVPWRILPTPVRAGFLKSRLDADLLALLNQVFEALPEILIEAGRPIGRSAQAAHSNSPSQAA